MFIRKSYRKKSVVLISEIYIFTRLCTCCLVIQYFLLRSSIKLLYIVSCVRINCSYILHNIIQIITLNSHKMKIVLCQFLISVELAIILLRHEHNAHILWVLVQFSLVQFSRISFSNSNIGWFFFQTQMVLTSFYYIQLKVNR